MYLYDLCRLNILLPWPPKEFSRVVEVMSRASGRERNTPWACQRFDYWRIVRKMVDKLTPYYRVAHPCRSDSHKWIVIIHVIPLTLSFATILGDGSVAMLAMVMVLVLAVFPRCSKTCFPLNSCSLKTRSVAHNPFDITPTTLFTRSTTGRGRISSFATVAELQIVTTAYTRALPSALSVSETFSFPSPLVVSILSCVILHDSKPLPSVWPSLFSLPSPC